MSRTDLDSWEDKQTAKRRKVNDVAIATKLGAAKHALARVSEIPDIVELIDNAEAIRAAAKAKHISAEGINAWTRFVVDAERKAWARIKAMDDAHQLAKHRRPKGSELQTLSDLDEGLTKQRTHEWSMLAKLTEHQLDAIERAANEADRLLTRSELLALSKVGTPMPTKEPRARSAEALKIIAQARERYASDDIQIDDDAKITKTDREAWVAAWVRVEDELARSDLNDDEGV